MLVEYRGTRQYLLTALDAAPDIFDQLLCQFSTEEVDLHPDPARFSVREIIAHLADWDEVFLARMSRTLAENEPIFEDQDEGQRAVDGDYASTNIEEQSRLFRQRRTLMVEFARSLTPEQWQLHCVHPHVGRASLEAITLIIPLHDTYHIQQLMEWRRSLAK